MCNSAPFLIAGHKMAPTRTSTSTFALISVLPHPSGFLFFCFYSYVRRAAKAGHGQLSGFMADSRGGEWEREKWVSCAYQNVDSDFNLFIFMQKNSDSSSSNSGSNKKHSALWLAYFLVQLPFCQWVCLLISTLNRLIAPTLPLLLSHEHLLKVIKSLIRNGKATLAG